MKPFLSFVFALLLAVTGFAATADESRAIEAEIVRLESTRIDALLKGDIKTLEGLYSDQLIYIHSAGRIDTKQGYLGALKSGNLTYVTVRYEPAERIVVVNRDLAIASGVATIETKNKAGQVTKRALTTTTVYARSGATWQIVSYQGTPVQS